jgi:hypothetical protein
MRRVVTVVLIAFAASMIILALTRAPDAEASVAYSSPYSFDQTYATSLRMLRVDMGFKILEKDKDLGYILFEYTSPESAKPVPGSIELVETKSGVNVGVQIPAMPQYHERMLVDQLAKKLGTEYGEPPKPADKDKDKSKDKDADKDKDKSKDKDKDGADKDKPKDGDKDKPKDGDDKKFVSGLLE